MALTTNFELIESCLKYNIPLVGVFSKNELPRQMTPGGYIINLQDSHDANGKPLDGTHWTSFYIEKTKNGYSRAVYFDPFGCVPPVSVQKFLSRLKPYPYCSFDIQSINSGVCGWYSLWFLWFMSRENIKYPDLYKRFDAFLEEFSFNPMKNRKILEELLKQVK